MPSPPGCESDPFFDHESHATKTPTDDLYAQVDLSGVTLHRFITEQRQALTKQLAALQPPAPRPPKPRVRNRGAVIRGEA
jgi:hypothetical protein